MPNVPVYSNPSVAPNELPGVRQQTPYRLMQAAEIGPGQTMKTGQAMISGGAEVMRFVTQDQIQQNEAKAKEYDANLMGGIQAVLYGSPDDPDSGFMNQKGKNAVDAHEDTVKKLQQLPIDQGQSLDNEAQQKLVKTSAQLRIQSAIAEANRHMSQQSTIYQNSAGDVRLKVAQDSAASAYNPITDSPKLTRDTDKPPAPPSGTTVDNIGPNTIGLKPGEAGYVANVTPGAAEKPPQSTYQLSLQTIRSEALDKADRMGMTDPDLRDAFVKEAMQKAYIGTLAHMLDGKNSNPAQIKVAQKYFDSVKDELTTEQQDRIRPVLEAGANKDQALSLALDIKTKAPTIGAQEDILNDKFKNGEINAEIHGLALSHLRQDNAQLRSEQVEKDKSVIGTVWETAHKGGSLASLSAPMLAYIKTRGLGPQVDAIFKRNKPGSEALDDSKMYSDLARMSSEDPVAFTKMDLSTVSGQLSQSHWNHLVGIQTAINRQDVKAMEINKVTHNTITAAKASLVASGFNMNPKPGTSEAKKLEAFETDLRDALTAAQPTWAEKKYTPAQIAEESRTIMLGHLKDQALANTGYFGTTWGQVHKRVYEMPPDERAKPWVIPDTDRNQIKASLQRQGLPVDEATIQRVYKASQGVR